MQDSIDYDVIQEIDRWALHKLADLTRRVIRAYENYEFHKIYHIIHTFCVVDMSALYLDIIKDRLYVEGKTSPERRSCQTVLYHVADTLLRLLAPILPFTMEEVYQSLMVSTGKRDHNPLSDDSPITESIHMQDLPIIPSQWNNPELGKRWERLLETRDLIVKVLEDARRKKDIGHSLDAIVTIATISDDTIKFLESYKDFLADFCIVSHIELHKVESFGAEYQAIENHPEIAIRVVKAPWQKCTRCWKLHPEVNKDTEYPEVCSRCAKVMKKYMSPNNGPG
jgi:isoleucyl-tRNA synthetase